MFWKRSLPKIRKGRLTILEEIIIDTIIKNLPENPANRLKGQIRYLTMLRRIPYENYCVIELYPETLNGIPDSLLFDRKEEFKLAYLKFKVDDMTISAEATAVLGSLFEIKIKSKLKTYEVDENTRINVLESKIEKP